VQKGFPRKKRNKTAWERKKSQKLEQKKKREPLEQERFIPLGGENIDCNLGGRRAEALPAT